MFLIQSFGEDPNESKSGNMLTHMEEIKIWRVGIGKLNHMFLIFSPQCKITFCLLRQHPFLSPTLSKMYSLKCALMYSGSLL